MKKSRGIIVLILSIVLTGFLCYVSAVGIGPTGTGAAKNINLGLDLSGGVSITYEAVDDNPSSEDMSDTVYKLQKRVEQYSTEAQVYKEGSNRINVEIPGVTDANEILEELGTPGSLYFITEADEEGNENITYGTDGYVLARDLDDIIASGSVVLEGSDIADAQGGATTDSTTQATQYVVSLTLTKDGTTKFAEATEANVGNQIAIIYDNEVLSAPRVNEAITGGSAQITGMESVEEAQNLASFIRIGSLSLELQEIRSSVVAAQLGVDAIATSLKAAAIGLALVILFMIWAYRVPGAVAGLALVFYTALMLITINAFDITLTLPGIAGIILDIGMAVDANVIIYARIREEIGAGNSVKTSIRTGFKKAFSAIFDGNITTLIAAFVLMWLGTGTVKGFAYTLAIGIIISMFTALVFSRIVVNALYAVGVQSEKWYGQTTERKAINFVGKKRVFFTLSIVMILLGPAFMIIHGVSEGKALNYSLEFSGGTSTVVTFNEEMDMSELDDQVVPVVEKVTGDANVQITKSVGSAEATIKTRTLNVDERQALDDALVENFNVDPDNISAESISATVSSEMRRDAVIAVIVATICMLIYIWFRFKDIRFASSAVLALLHDVLVVLAFYAIVRVSVGNTFIACMLTIVGYSINATIVIFDRIRENTHGVRDIAALEEIVNTSITQTLTRSIYTSLTTFIMVFLLFIMGVSSIREFALPLMVGIVCGAYSSVCITGALWLVLKQKIKAKAADNGNGTIAVRTEKAAAKKPGKASANGGQTQNDPTQPKKKNRKRVAERLAAQEAAAKEQENKTDSEE